jgi:hypothetical protein
MFAIILMTYWVMSSDNNLVQDLIRESEIQIPWRAYRHQRGPNLADIASAISITLSRTEDSHSLRTLDRRASMSPA